MPRLLLAFIVMLALTVRARAQTEPGRGAEPSVVPVPGATAGPAKPHGRDPRVDRLEDALEDLSAAEVSSATWSAVSNFIAGGLLVGYGTWVLVEHAATDEDDSSALAAGGFALSIGGMSLALAVHALFARSTDDLRLERWRVLRAKGLIDDRALARFEGELAAEAQVTRWTRTVTGVAYIGVAASGAAMIALAAAGKVPSGLRDFAYIEGGFLVALGVWQSTANLAGTWRTEDIVRRYLDGEAAPSLSLAPHPTGAQLRLSARF
jgi:hypothetical protein